MRFPIRDPFSALPTKFLFDILRQPPIHCLRLTKPPRTPHWGCLNQIVKVAILSGFEFWMLPRHNSSWRRRESAACSHEVTRHGFIRTYYGVATDPFTRRIPIRDMLQVGINAEQPTLVEHLSNSSMVYGSSTDGSVIFLTFKDWRNELLFTLVKGNSLSVGICPSQTLANLNVMDLDSFEYAPHPSRNPWNYYRLLCCLASFLLCFCFSHLPPNCSTI